MTHKDRILDVLRKGNYVITYKFDTVADEGIVTTSWDKQSYNVRYNCNTQEIYGSLFSEPVKCKPYFIPAILYQRLREFCEERKYAYKFLENYLDEEPTKMPHFPFTDDMTEATNAVRFGEIYMDAQRYGLQQDAAASATHEELEFILQSVFNIKATIC